MFIPNLDAFRHKFDRGYDFSTATREILANKPTCGHAAGSDELSQYEARILAKRLERAVYGTRRSRRPSLGVPVVGGTGDARLTVSELQGHAEALYTAMRKSLLQGLPGRAATLQPLAAEVAAEARREYARLLAGAVRNDNSQPPANACV